MKTNYSAIRVRKLWNINPAEKVHSTPKGLIGYDRRGNKQDIDEALAEYEMELEEYEY